MIPVNPLDIDYRSHKRVQRLIDTIRFGIEDISLSYDRWGEPYTTGPRLYFAVISGHKYNARMSREALFRVDKFRLASREQSDADWFATHLRGNSRSARELYS